MHFKLLSTIYIIYYLGVLVRYYYSPHSIMFGNIKVLVVCIIVGINQLVDGTPVPETTSSVHDSENFAQNLLKCVEEERSQYNDATIMFSGYCR